MTPGELARATEQAEVLGLSYEVDFYWPAHRLVVEVDGFAFHRTRAAFERDRRAHRGRTTTAEGHVAAGREPFSLSAQLGALTATPG